MLNQGLGTVYKDGALIIKEGDLGTALFVIQTGNVRIVKHDDDHQRCLATLGPGEIFGEMALFDQQKRSASAVACGEARVLTVDRQKFFTTMSRDPTVSIEIFASMSRRLRHMNDALCRLHE